MELYFSDNKVQNEQLKREIEDQLMMFNEVLCTLSYSDSAKKLYKDLLGNKELISFYNSKDADGLVFSYENAIKRLRKSLFKETDSEEMIIAKACEYIRLMTFKDNLVLAKSVEDLNKSSICPMFIGKGTDLAQIKLLRDLLPTKMDSIMSRVNDSVKSESHDVLVTRNNDKFNSIDIVNYNGTSESLNKNYHLDYYSETVTPVKLFDDLIISAREEVANYLISELRIDEISEMILNDSMSTIDKHYAIMGYISTRIVHCESEVAFNIACINGHFIEAGKLMELFFMYNNIPYKVEGKNKENSIYEVKVDDCKYKLDPKEMYNSNYDTITDYLHYTEDKGDKYYLSLMDELNYTRNRAKIERSVLVGTYVNEEIFSEGIKKSLIG